MMRYVAPLEKRLRHLTPPDARAHLFRVHGGVASEQDVTLGQRLAEHAAATIGSWAFLAVQSGLLALWVLVNAVRLAGFDPPPFILLNLMLSFQAAFTGPILLIAANVGALRDHKQYDRMEEMERRLDAKLERLLRAQRGSEDGSEGGTAA